MKNLKDKNGNTVLGNIIPDFILARDGNIEAISDELMIDFAVLQRYINESQECIEMLAIVRERMAQRAERALKERIASGDSKSIQFALKSLKPDIYGEKQDITVSAKSPKETEKYIKTIFGIQEN